MISNRAFCQTKRYPAVNPEYLQEIFENRFKPENLAKLSNDFATSCRSTKKQVREGDIVRIVNVEADAVPGDITNMVHFTHCCRVFKEALAHIVDIGRPGTGSALRAALDGHFEYLLRSYIFNNNNFEGLRAYHFMFHKKRAILGIDDPLGWEAHDAGLIQLYLKQGSPWVA